MSENNSSAPYIISSLSPAEVQTSAHEESKRPRGKIPRAAWGYVLGLYDLSHETLKVIGDRYGVEPSAVHYVLRQARALSIEPTLEQPSEEMLAASRKTIAPRRDALPRSVRSIFEAKPAPKPVDEAVLQVNNSPIAKRVFDSSADIINAILAFEKDPSKDNQQKLDDARKLGARALAGVEIWMHQTVQTHQAKMAMGQAALDNHAHQPTHQDVHVQDERLPEIA